MENPEANNTRQNIDNKINTLAIPKLIYHMSLLPMSEDLVKNVNKILYTYIWRKFC